MTFQVCTREAGSIVERGSFDTVDLAQAEIKVLRDRGLVAFMRQVESDTSWHSREQWRFECGDYIRLPWHSEDWHLPHINLFGHVSKDNGDKVAYTASNEHGMQDRQTRIKAGRYLTMVGCPDVNYWVAVYNGMYCKQEVKFAETPDEFQRIYENGPSSCMSHSVRHYDSSVHPVRVYATGELRLAYIEDGEDNITARALVRPSKMVHCRIYGDESRLGARLTDLGYNENWERTLDGVRLTRIDDRNGIVMPYLDAICTADFDGDYVVITSNGDIDCCTTNGIANDNSHSCYYCGDRVDEGEGYYDDDGDYWCDDCYSSHFNSCVRCDRTYCVDSSNGTMCGDDFYCDRCASRYLSSCVECDETFLSDDVICSDYDSEYRCESCHETHVDEQEDDDDDEIIYSNVDEYVAEFTNMLGVPEKTKVYGLPAIYSDPYYDTEFTWEKVYDAAMSDNHLFNVELLVAIRATIPMLPFMGV